MFFDDTWSVHVHSPVDSDWRLQSYKVLRPLSSVNDFWMLWNSIEHCVTRTMLFVMRDGIHPSWDDPANLDGSIAACIVKTAEAASVFCDVVQRVVSERLCPESPCDVNGVSMGPKKGFCVIKIWMATTEADSERLSLPASIDRSAVRVQPCRAHINSAKK